jgi:hypothetical protein
MTNHTIDRETRRAARITGAMIDHAIAVLEAADEAFTHVEADGEICVCIDCVVKCLRAGWGKTVPSPKVDDHWRTLGCVTLDLIKSARASVKQTATRH